MHVFSVSVSGKHDFHHDLNSFLPWRYLTKIDYGGVHLAIGVVLRIAGVGCIDMRQQSFIFVPISFPERQCIAVCLVSVDTGGRFIQISIGHHRFFVIPDDMIHR